MKQLPMTTELSALIQKAVGPDVETQNLAVFETIALNTNPLPGKDGTVFEDAVVTPLTLRQMVDSINGGAHLPLISDHQLMGEPKGRVFHADLLYGSSGELEMRALFYMDPTEDRLIAKLNAGSLDEVSVSFLSSEFTCSECGWDYLGPEATYTNLIDATCGNGHVIGDDGVHAVLNGLSEFVELSLVARGAADNPKIVGRSDSKLQPATALRLAARGFEADGLIVRASRGEQSVSTPFDPTSLINDLASERARVITLTATKMVDDASVATLTANLSAATEATTQAEARVAELEVELAAAQMSPSQTDLDLAVTFLQSTLSKVIIASGGDEPAADKLPSTVAALTAEIAEKTTALTAILPVGGIGAPLNGGDSKPNIVASAYSLRNLK